MPNQSDPNQNNSATAPPVITPTADLLPVISTNPKKKFAGGRIIATILGVLLLVGGVGAGILLTQQKQLIPQKAAEVAPQCLAIKIYDDSGVLLTNTQFATLPDGTTVNFCVTGSATSETFDKAQFLIGGTLESETSKTLTGVDGYCQSYQIKSTDTSIVVKAKIHISTLGWFGENI